MSGEAPKVALVHLGCAKNLVDSEHMLGTLAASGATLTSNTGDAEVLVINTCAFIGPAKEESVARILEGERWKAERPGRRLIVAGCLAERYGDELKAEVPGIDSVLGTHEVTRVATAAWGGEVAAPSGRRLPTFLADHTTPRLLATPRHSVYLKISEGCDHTCSFCIIPTLRGRHRSRPIESLVAEATALARDGARELNLVAQDSTSYGQDLGCTDGPSRLLEALAQVPGVEWIRVHYTYPTAMTRSFIETLATEPKVVKYIDMPLQHASKAVLKAMRRGGDGASYLRLLERIRARVPEVAIRSTFIVGFPGETERRFAELLRFLESAELDRVGVFTYSHEEGTAAHALKDRIPQDVKEARRAELMRVQAGIARSKSRALVGSRQRVLVDGPAPRAAVYARLPSQAPDVDGHVLVEGSAAAAGSFLDVTVTSARVHDLVASAA